MEAEANRLDAGSSGKVKVELKKPGIYEMYCPVDGHRAEGLKGKITVKLKFLKLDEYAPRQPHQRSYDKL